MDVLRETHFRNLGEKQSGKVRDIYAQPERLVLISTDRHSSFDRIIAHIPGKGAVLNSARAFSFEQTKDIVPNHVIDLPDPNVTIAKRCTPLPLEVVLRGYLTGVTSTSLWTHYQGGQRDFGSFTLPDGMHKNQKLDYPVFTPSTKEKDHDRTVTPQEIIDAGLVSKEMLDEVEQIALAVFTRGQEIAAEHGLILVDTKYEFGLDANGVLTLIDEVHTPDSSRWWQAATYRQRVSAGYEPEYFDKEFLRLWFMEHCDPYADAVLPDAPPELIDELSSRYFTIYRQLTGKDLELPDGSVEERIAKNVASYAI